MTPTSWYRRWFGEEYLQLYPHRDQAEAGEGIELVLRSVDVPSGGRALDVACGAGRHLREMERRGLRPVGLDLSLPLLSVAREAGLRVVRGDMRELPFAADAFELVTNFFTSFGYFDDPAEDIRVATEVRRVLRPGGAFVFDFLNAARVREELQPRDERHVGPRRIVQTRHLLEGGRVVEKRIEFHDPSDRLPHIFHERVRLYEPEELRELLNGAGLAVDRAFGDYTGSGLEPASPRVLLLGRRV